MEVIDVDVSKRNISYIVYHTKIGGAMEARILHVTTEDKDWGNQLRSFGWFNRREQKKAFGNPTRQRKARQGQLEWAQGVPLTDHEHLKYKLLSPDKPIEDLPVHKTVWDLYEAMGYDRASQKYKTKQ